MSSRCAASSSTACTGRAATPVERGVERGQREAEAAGGPRLDQLGDLVAVVPFVLDDRQDHDLGAAFLGLVNRSSRCHAGPLYEGELYITRLTVPAANWLA